MFRSTSNLIDERECCCFHLCSIWGSGKPLRQFIFSIDLAKLMVWTMRSYEEADPIILSGEPYTMIPAAYKILSEKLSLDLPPRD